MSTPQVIVGQSSGEGQTAQARRRFAAKYHHRGWGVGLGIFGVLCIIVGLTSGASGLLGGIIVGAIPLAISVYLLRGHGVDPKVAQRKAAKRAQIAERKAAQMSQATVALHDAVSAGHRGGAAVAYRHLWTTARREYPEEAQAQVDEALTSIGVDAKSLESQPIGAISSMKDGAQLEVFRDWIIYGEEAHDVDATTRGDVYMDGSVQMTSTVVPSGKGSQVQNKQVDTRTAQVQFVSSSWGMGVPIHPEQANAARLVVAQLGVHVESLKPQGITAQDIRSMVDAILNNTGQPPAEKLQQLSNLRYQRLLSDEEFDQAKSKILGITS